MHVVLFCSFFPILLAQGTFSSQKQRYQKAFKDKVSYKSFKVGIF